MTEGPDASPRRGWTAWRVVTPVAVLLCGGLFAVSAHNSGGTDLRPGRYTDLAALVRTEARQYDGLQGRVTRLNDEVAALTASVDNDQVEFSEGFTDLHTRSYEEIVAGRGFGLDQVRASIDIVSTFRNAPVGSGSSLVHPFARKGHRA